MSQVRGFIKDAMSPEAGPIPSEDLINSSEAQAEALEQIGQSLQSLSEVAHTLESIAVQLADNLGEGLTPEAAAVMNQLVAKDLCRVGISAIANPSMETYYQHAPVATRISMENIRSLLTRVINAIREFLRQLFRRVGDFFVRVFGDTGRARLRMEYLDNECEDINGLQPRLSKVNIGSYAYNVATERGVPADGRALVGSMTELLKQLKGLRQHYLPTIVQIGHGLGLGLAERPSGEEGLESWLGKLNDVAALYNVSSFTKVSSKLHEMTDARYPNGSAQSGAPLPGCRTLVFLDGRKIYPEKLEGTVAEQANAFQASRIELTRLAPQRTIDTANAVMDTMPTTSIYEVLALVGALLDEIDESANSSFHHDLQRHGRELDAGAARVGVGDEAELMLVRRGLQYCEVYGQWMHKPYLQMLNHALTVSRGALGVCARHIKAYHG